MIFSKSFQLINNIEYLYLDIILWEYLESELNFFLRGKDLDDLI